MGFGDEPQTLGGVPHRHRHHPFAHVAGVEQVVHGVGMFRIQQLLVGLSPFVGRVDPPQGAAAAGLHDLADGGGAQVFIEAFERIEVGIHLQRARLGQGAGEIAVEGGQERAAARGPSLPLVHERPAAVAQQRPAAAIGGGVLDCGEAPDREPWIGPVPQGAELVAVGEREAAAIAQPEPADPAAGVALDPQRFGPHDLHGGAPVGVGTDPHQVAIGMGRPAVCRDRLTLRRWRARQHGNRLQLSVAGPAHGGRPQPFGHLRQLAQLGRELGQGLGGDPGGQIAAGPLRRQQLGGAEEAAGRSQGRRRHLAGGYPCQQAPDQLLDVLLGHLRVAVGRLQQGLHRAGHPAGHHPNPVALAAAALVGAETQAVALQLDLPGPGHDLKAAARAALKPLHRGERAERHRIELGHLPQKAARGWIRWKEAASQGLSGALLQLATAPLAHTLQKPQRIDGLGPGPGRGHGAKAGQGPEQQSAAAPTGGHQCTASPSSFAGPGGHRNQRLHPDAITKP